MTGKRGRPSAAEAGARDERVVDVVVAVLTGEGLEALTLDRVSAEAHVAKRTLYTVFGDRAGLVRAAVRRQHAYLEDAGDGAVDLRSAARGILRHLLGDEAIGVHRAITGAAALHPLLAREFYEEGPARAQGFLAAHLPADAPVSPALLFTALLGESHRRRLLGLTGPFSVSEIDAQVDEVLRAFGLGPSDPARSGQESSSS
ncbi:TetR/AcrR family transcriptional regulator C-terminal domain-containing protein [Microbacterium foliorum]|uniref:TetR/AcrR family transcriptional regulator C-terminal domain-containing protein n=1 Tax=Microbacterium foliorum TaxID=104336 RepID=UPI0028D00170|nr:TetR/AcrR family transcriptional regulator C-terminal domain-containing protein [Microbacterium foliorum]